MSTPAVVENKTNFTLTTKHAIKADATTGKGIVPDRIQLLAAGKWLDSWKGSIEITFSDLEEFEANFNTGVGLANGGTEGAAIDYSHEDWKKAAAWIKKVEIENGILYASEIDWTPAGRQAVEDGEYKFISPSFYPACMGQYTDPEDPTKTARNVLVGAGLTNIPFFKGLTGLKASQTLSGADDENTIYLTASSEGDEMKTVADILKKAPADVTEDERKILADNRTQLTADQLVTFKVDASSTAPVTAFTDEQKAAINIKASIDSGEMVLVKASDKTALEGRVDAAEKAIEDFKVKDIKAHVEAGAKVGKIKTDQISSWVDMIKADSSGNVQKAFDALSENKIINEENGEDGSAILASASEELDRQAQALVKADSKLTYKEALKAAREAHPELIEQLKAERQAR